MIQSYTNRNKSFFLKKKAVIQSYEPTSDRFEN